MQLMRIGAGRRREAGRPGRRRRPTSTCPTWSRDFDEASSPAGTTGCARRSRRPDRGRRRAHVRRRADRRADRPAAPDPLHRAELPRPRRRDRPGRAGRADPVHQVAEHPGRPERRRAHPARVHQARLGGRARHRDRPRGPATSTRPSRRRRRDRRLRAVSTTSASAPSRSSAAASGRRASPRRRSTRPGRGWPPPTRSTTSRDLDMWLDVNGVRRQTGSTATMVFDPYVDRALPEPVPGARAGRPDQHRHAARRRHGPQAAGLAAARRRDGARHRRARQRSASRSSRRGEHARVRRSPAPGKAEVQEVDAPVAGPGEVVVDVERVGVCGTDVEFFTGEMAYLHTGPGRVPDAARPRVVRHGVARSATGVDPAWVGRRVTGDTMLGCGHCAPLPAPAASTCARTGTRSASAAAGPARWPSSCRSRSRALHRAAGRGRRHARRAGRARRQRAARGRRPPGSAPGDRVLVTGPGHDRPAGRPVRPRRGAEVHLLGLPVPGLRRGRWASRTSGPRTTLPDAALRRGDRRLQRRRAARAGPRPGRAGRPGGLHRPRRRRPASSTPARSRSRTSPRSASSAPPAGWRAPSSAYAAGRGRPASAGGRHGRPGRRRPPCWPAGATRRWGPAPKIHVDPRL